MKRNLPAKREDVRTTFYEFWMLDMHDAHHHQGKHIGRMMRQIMSVLILIAFGYVVFQLAQVIWNRITSIKL